MLRNECIMSPPVEKLKQNGSLATLLSSPILRKDENSVLSLENRPAQSQVTGSSPESGNHVVEETVTPDVKSHCKSKYYACPPSAGSVKHLHRTPPSRAKNIVVSNPFDVGIADRLPFPMYSPSVFARVVSPSQDSPTFRWTIEDISRIYPADIEEFPAHQYDEVVDPELESKAQEAINRFFCKNQPLLPSPWNPKPDSAATLRQEINIGTPSAQHAAISATPVHASPQRGGSDSDLDQSSNLQKQSSREVWTQTTLTLPPVLPPSMELALKPFFTFTQDQQQAQQIAEGDEGSLSTSSLRRKLFFHTESSPLPAPSTPPQHPNFHSLHGSTSHSLVQFQGRSFGTPLPGTIALHSSPGISPVHSGATPMRRVKSATRLDFSRDQEEMSLDSSVQNPPGTPRHAHLTAQAGACSPLGTAPLHDKEIPDDHANHLQLGVKWAKRNKRNSLNCSTDAAMSMSQTSTPVKNSISMDVSSAHNMMDISQSKPSNLTEGWPEGESMVDAAYQHEVSSFSYSQQAASSNMISSQDTGYATRSSSDTAAFQSGTNSMFGLSLTRDKMGYEDSLATWPINPNVVSSTPTKTLGARLSEYQRDTA